MLNLHQSNRLEALAGQLAAVARVPLASVFAAETVVVQSHGVARWLALQLARASGVCANVRFAFPAGFAWALYRALGDLPQRSPYDPAVMAWRIMQLLPALEREPAFAPVRAYVRDDLFRRYELAHRIAETFEQYLIYRPDWIAAWDAGAAPHWQARLWRRVAQAAGAPHRARLHRDLVARLDAGLLARAAVPERVSVFGASALPPMLLELFAALAAHIDVHLFILNPCREYWGDIARAGEIARRKLARRAEAAYLETGNGLLASLGKQGRDFIDLLQNHPAQERDGYVEPGEGHLLAALQSDVLNLREREATRGLEVRADDSSVQIHVCHGAMREVEVLHDQLLALFERHPDLEPSDVVVMTPDIEKYAPYIEAVFAATEPRIPFNISDRSAERESTLAAAFLALLDLPGSRYAASEMLELLDEPAVQRRYALNAEDIDTIHRWVRESGIRWGIDAQHRAALGLPATREHTWRFGLDRLLLGCALAGGNERLFAGILPYDEVEGSLADILGRFLDFAEAALALNELPALQSVPQWASVLREILARFFEPDESREEEQIAGLRAAIAAIESEALAGGFDGAISLDVLKRALRARLEIPGRAFLSGGVTFCAMVPMRSLPFEVVCLIGMNDGAFPRTRRAYGFDLMASDFRKGDRSRRDDDRYLFLESLLCARRSLYVSYTGQHIRDNSALPPSVLVSELLDYLAENFRGAGGQNMRDQLVTHHALQGFSPRYFDGKGKLFSYSAARCEAARLAGRGYAEAQPFMPDALPAPEAEWRAIELEALIRFFRHPARYFLRERLGIRLEEAGEAVDGREPLVFGALEQYALKQRLLAVRMRGEPLPGALPAARASGLLPHAQVGAVVFDQSGDEAAAFAEKLLPVLPERMPEPLGFEFELAGMRLRGTLAGVSPAGLLGYRLAKCQAKDLLEAWLRHLALNTLEPAGVVPETHWFLQDRVVRFAAVRGARDRLAALVELYWRGLSRPLHFFPQSAKAYIERGASIDAARRQWEHSDHRHGEGEDPYYRLAFRDCDPLDAEFEALALAVFGPMTAAMIEEARAA